MPDGFMVMVVELLKMAAKALSKYVIQWITSLAQTLAGVDLRVLLMSTS
jgi:hypothetical protein